jgi:AAA15 family ATPase/GTPase
VGTNASSKSNIRDAFRFLHGISRGYNLAKLLVRSMLKVSFFSGVAFVAERENWSSKVQIFFI